MKDTIVVIPAHLNSKRLPKKILLNIMGLPMIEHVRRRLMLSIEKKNIFVATCDKSISNIVEHYGGNVIFTSKKHTNGTSRVSEAINKIKCNKVILAQGDEPLMLPNLFKKFYDEVNDDKESFVWNATAPINTKDYSKRSFVKCQINYKNNIVKLFRTTNKSILAEKNLRIRKILGLIAFKKEVLIKYKKLKKTSLEDSLSIEQIRYLENNINIKSVFLSKSSDSINEPKDVKVVINNLKKNKIQKIILNKILV